MLTVARGLVSISGREGNRLVVDASDLGIRPGLWPNAIKIEGYDAPFELKRLSGGDEDVVAGLYENTEGMKLTVYND